MERRREAEDIIAMKVAVAAAVAPDPRGKTVPPTRYSRLSDGVLHCPISQPASIAPVKPFLPGLEELLEGGQGGALLLTGLLGPLEVEVVASTRWLVRKYHT